MPTETPTRNERGTPERVAQLVEPEGEDAALRALAVRQIQRVRAFKAHAAAFVIGVPVVGGVWVLTEYFENDTWPSRFVANDGDPGNWDPWYFWFVGVWLVILAVHAWRTYTGRYVQTPPTSAEIDREIVRLKLRR